MAGQEKVLEEKFKSVYSCISNAKKRGAYAIGLTVVFITLSIGGIKYTAAVASDQASTKTEVAALKETSKETLAELKKNNELLQQLITQQAVLTVRYDESEKRRRE